MKNRHYYAQCFIYKRVNQYGTKEKTSQKIGMITRKVLRPSNVIKADALTKIIQTRSI